MGQKYYDKTAERALKVNDFVTDKQTKKELELAERPIIDDKKINVLVMGISGAGKSTLINSVLGEERAKVGDGVAITQKMKVYESDKVNFRMVDTVGLEFNYDRQQKIQKELSKWSEDGLNRKNFGKLIHCIWFCIDAQSKRVSEESLNYLYRISKMWNGIPIIVVFTKSYSTVAIAENEAMFKKVMAKYEKKKKLNVCNVISVLARELVIDEDLELKKYGVDALIDATTELMPKAKEINEEVMTDWSFKMRRDAAKKYVKAAKRNAFTITLVPTRGDDEKVVSNVWNTMQSKIAKAFVLSSGSELMMREKASKIIKRTKIILTLTKPFKIANSLLVYFVTGKIGNKAIKVAEKAHKEEIKIKQKAEKDTKEETEIDIIENE